MISSPTFGNCCGLIGRPDKYSDTDKGSTGLHMALGCVQGRFKNNPTLVKKIRFELLARRKDLSLVQLNY